MTTSTRLAAGTEYEVAAQQRAAELQAIATMSRRQSVVSWQAILAGTAISIGAMVLVETLWNALAFSSNNSWVRDNLAWLDAGTAIAVLFLGGLLAGWFGRRGLIAGLANSLSVWGLLIVGGTVFGLGTSGPLATLDVASTVISEAPLTSFWPTFVALSIGLVAAMAGGFVGGGLPSTELDDAIIGLTDQPSTVGSTTARTTTA